MLLSYGVDRATSKLRYIRNDSRQTSLQEAATATRKRPWGSLGRSEHPACCELGHGRVSSTPVKRAVSVAVSKLLEPIVPLLLEAGLGVGEFERLLRRAYVEAASQMGSRAGPLGETTASRGRSPPARSNPTIAEIAMRTGLTRMGVANLLQAPSEESDSSDIGRQRAERVLNGWRHDPEFQDRRSGTPAFLPLRGEKRSLTALIRRFSGDPRVRTIRQELERVRAIRRRPDGRWQLLRDTYATSDFDADGLTALGQQIHEHLKTLVHNLGRPPLPLYARRVVNLHLDPEEVGKLLRDMALQGDALMESIDASLNDPSATLSADEAAGRPVRLGAAFYVFQDSPTEPAAHVTGPSRAAAPGRGRKKQKR
ncbi:MAG: DUF6502 family protein [Gammaproteobacteria bacterium]